MPDRRPSLPDWFSVGRDAERRSPLRVCTSTENIYSRYLRGV
jgi:hypothetical protein